MTHTLTGTLRIHHALRSRFVDVPRDVIVYLPPEYNLHGQDIRYPVLYLHDGQNLFDSATAFAGNEWGLDELAEELIQAKRIQPLIIVGIYNAGNVRISEYTHVRNRKGAGGKARAYGKMIVDDLKPFIDSEYRTVTDPPNTGLGGSSLGGLVTLYLGMRNPEVFGKLVVMSPSVWWANRALIREVRRSSRKAEQKIWLDTGTCEGDDPETCVKNVRDLRDALADRGWIEGRDLRFVEDEGAGHDEKAWGHRMRDALLYLFPA